MVLTSEVANDLRFDDEVAGIEVVARTDDGEGRWESHHTAVLTIPGVEGYWALGYSLGLTEIQEHRPFDEDVTLYEVVPRVIEVTVFEEKK